MNLVVFLIIFEVFKKIYVKSRISEINFKNENVFKSVQGLCRNPIKKNGKILSCNTDLGFDHKALDEETGQVFKCRPCKNVTDTFLELREEQQRIH